jgi:hypothetical protein
VLCRGLCYEGGPNGTISTRTRVYLKSVATQCHGSHCKADAWTTYLKTAAVEAPAATFETGPLRLALRTGSFTVQWLNISRTNVTNLSFVPPLTAGSALPTSQHLGDVTLRVRPAAAKAGEAAEAAPASAVWAYFSSAWGPFAADALPSPLQPTELAAHDITPLLDATAAPDAAGVPGSAGSFSSKSPVNVRRAYTREANGAFGLKYTLTNTAESAVEVGSFGMPMPSAVSQVRCTRPLTLCICRSPRPACTPTPQPSLP